MQALDKMEFVDVKEEESEDARVSVKAVKKYQV